MGVLNFDPFAALREIQNRSVLRATSANPATKPAFVAFVADVACSTAQNEKCETGQSHLGDPAHWRTALAELHPAQPRHGIAPDRWSAVLEDARWLALAHGENAARHGWSASQLFTINPIEGWGGLADRLDGARHLTIDSRKAVWRWQASASDEWGMLIRQGRTGRLALEPRGVLIWN